MFNRMITFLLVLLFLLSLLVLFRAPTNRLWYVSILVTEFSWIFFVLAAILLFYPAGHVSILHGILGFSVIGLSLLPYYRAWALGRTLKEQFRATFPNASDSTGSRPFQISRVITGLFTRRIAYCTLTYHPGRRLTLDFYPAAVSGKRPCVLVIHGGSWAAGNSRQLPELNSEMAKWGYHVACINYRLAPAHHYPAPLEDVQAALQFLQQQAEHLSLDGSRLVLLGRSAGAQIALSAAYTLSAPAIKAVIDFYGPTDMVWGYENPTHPLVMNSQKIMEDYLGGTLQQRPGQYRHSSATETVTAHTPPSLLLYAENDPLVSPRHGTRLSCKLKKAGIPFFELYLPWATHAFDYTLNGPGGQLSTWTVRRFLDAILK